MLDYNPADIWSLSIRTAFVGCLVFLLNYVFNLKKLIFGSKKVSVPVSSIRGLPLLGNAHQLVKTSWMDGVCPNAYTLQAISGLTIVFKKEKIYKINLGPRAFYILYNAEHVEKLLKSTANIDKPAEYDNFEPWLGAGLLTSQGSKWKSRRKMLTPTFHFKILDNFQPIMYEKSEELVKRLKSHANGEPFELMSVLMLCTLDIICETAMGYPIKALETADSPFVKNLHNLSEGVMLRILQPWLWPNFIWNLSSEGKKFNNSNTFVQNFVKKVISDRKAEHLRLGSDFVLGDRPAFLDLLIRHQIDDPTFTEQDIREEVNTFMFAGQDTTAAGLNWCTFLLGHHPEVQDKLAEELYEVLGEDTTRPITLEDLKELKYTEAIIREGQRMYPSIPVIGRKMTEDFWLDDVLIPKGAAAVILNRELAMDPRHFPDPLAFKPERFLPENSSGRNPFSYVPFSAGPRNCVGQRFSVLEMKTIMANVFRHYRIVSIEHRDQIAISPEIVARPSRPITFRITPRVFN